MGYKIITTIQPEYKLAEARIYRDTTHYLGRANVVLALQEDGQIRLSFAWSEGPLEVLAGELQLQIRGERGESRVMIKAEGSMPSAEKMNARKYRIGGNHARNRT